MKLRKIYFVILAVGSIALCWTTEAWSIWYIIGLFGCSIAGFGLAIEDLEWF